MWHVILIMATKPNRLGDLFLPESLEIAGRGEVRWHLTYWAIFFLKSAAKHNWLQTFGYDLITTRARYGLSDPKASWFQCFYLHLTLTYISDVDWSLDWLIFKAVACGGLVLNSIIVNVCNIYCKLHHQYSSTVSDSRWVIFPSLSFFLLNYFSEHISHHFPPSSLCVNKLCLCMFVFIWVSELSLKK